MKNKNLFLFNMAIADAYGAGFEFAPQEFVDANNTLGKYFSHPKDDIKPGYYTDDTQMSIAVSEAMMSNNMTPLGFANHFVSTYKRDQRLGYAEGFQKHVLDESKGGAEFIEIVDAKSSIRNGAAMRAVPLGLLPSKEYVLECAKLQARLTHNNLEGVTSSQAVALLAYFLYHENMSTHTALAEVIKTLTEFDLGFKYTERVPCEGIPTVQAVFTVLAECKTLSEVLYESIALGGDTDSVAAIAVGLASLSDDIDGDLPVYLKDELENGPYGADFLVGLGVELTSIFPANQ